MADVMSLRREAIANAPHLESASGSYASFETDIAAPLKECKVSFEPVQDLHGYDYPWPAGGGVNLLDIDNVNLTSSTYGFMPSKDGSTIILSGIYTREYSNASFRITADDAIPYIADTRIKAFPLNTDATNHISQVRWTNTTGGLAIDLINLELNTTYDIRFKVCIYKGSTTPAVWTPYENVCPITGFDGFRVFKTGKNLLDPEAFVQNALDNGIQTDRIAYNNGTITVLQSAYQENYTYYKKIKFKPNTSYTVSMNVKTISITDSRARMNIDLTRTLNTGAEYVVALYRYDLTEVGHTEHISFHNAADTTITTFRIGGWGWGGVVEITNLQIEEGSSETTYESYRNNIDVEFPVVGKNLFDINRSVGTPNPSVGDASTSPRVMDVNHFYVGLTRNNYYYPLQIQSYSVSDGTITITRGQNGGYGLGFPIEVNGGSRYYVSYTDGENITIGIGFYDANWNYLSNISSVTYFTTPDNCKYATVIISPLDHQTPGTLKNLQVELGNFATSFEPYTRTVYGGYFDLVSGNLNITSAYVRLTGTWLQFTYSGSGQFFYYRSGNNPGGKNNVGVFCSHLNPGGVGDSPLQGNISSYNGNLIRVNPKMTLEEWNQYIVDNKVMLSYELAEPIVYHLTPHQLKSFRGANNIWSNTNGNTEVEYWTH